MDERTGDTSTSSTTEPSDQRARPRRKVAALAVVLEADRPSAGCFVVPMSSTITIGRGETRRQVANRLEIPDRHLSRDHATVEWKEGHAIVSDTGSSNGTFVADERITRVTLESEVVFRAGHTLLAAIDDATTILDGSARWPFPTLSPTFVGELRRLERVAQSPLPILLLGETGVGKEVLARAIHERSGRPGAFVAVNCGALPGNLVEAHLFGHKKGAFSGAIQDELGFVRSAQNGTLFLDEIGDLPLAAQASLLRVLQEKEVTPVGAFHPVKVDVRVLSATHQPLDRERFRSDLLARISGFGFTVPPLRERALDIGQLVASFGIAIRGIRPDAATALLAHDFPMNVRELKQALEAAVVLGPEGVVRLEDLPSAITTPAPRAPLDADDLALRETLRRLLETHDRNISKVAREMGKARQQVQRWVKRFGL